MKLSAAKFLDQGLRELKGLADFISGKNAEGLYYLRINNTGIYYCVFVTPYNVGVRYGPFAVRPFELRGCNRVPLAPS